MQSANNPSNPFGTYYPPGQEESENAYTTNSAYNPNSIYNAANETTALNYTSSFDNNVDSSVQPPMTEVDLSKYPEPAESTKKIRGRSDILDEFFRGTINRELLIAKLFYLFFFSAFGSLLPLMAIYFKNMGMTPTQAGILIGIRPFVGFLSAPFWADLADR